MVSSRLFKSPIYPKGHLVKALLSAAALAVCVSACTPALVEKLPYYRLSVVQGIPLDAASVLAVKEGMTRQQVEMEIGAPLLRPSFRADRWDYVYEVSRGSKVKENHTLTIHFSADGTVNRIEGDALDFARQQIQHNQQGNQ